MISYRERREGSSFNGMVFMSLLLHAAILSLLFFSPSFPSPKLTFGPVHTVSLVSLPGAVFEQRKTAAVMKELLSADRPETILKKQIEPSSDAVPIRSLETHRKKDPEIEKAMEEIRKKAAAAGTVRQPQATAVREKIETLEKAEKTEIAGKTAGTASQRGAGSQAGDAEMDAQMRIYYAAIWSRIKGNWALPQGILPSEVLETVIDVTILRSGAVTEANFEKRSGNRYFDDSALKAVRKASPLPPLPAWIGDSSIAVGIRFHWPQMKR